LKGTEIEATISQYYILQILSKHIRGEDAGLEWVPCPEGMVLVDHLLCRHKHPFLHHFLAESQPPFCVTPSTLSPRYLIVDTAAFRPLCDVTTFVDPAIAFRMPIFFMRLVILTDASSFDSQNTNVLCSNAARIIRSALLRGLSCESPQGTPFPRRTSRSIGSSSPVVSCFPCFHPLINRIVNDNPY
jgi:hypothetical protein